MKYFWYWRPERDFPPPPIVRPDGISGGDRLNIACTQTTLPAREQRAIVAAWCELLPSLTGIRLLWFSSQVPQRLFDAACRVGGLDGLYIKWSGIEDLASLEQARALRHFHLGPSGRLSSIQPLAGLQRLRWLGLGRLSRIQDLDPLGRLTDLEGLSLEGSMGTVWRVRTLAPIGHLTSLRYLSIANLRAADRSLAALFSLRRLQAFHHATWWDAEELAEIRRRNPGLAE